MAYGKWFRLQDQRGKKRKNATRAINDKQAYEKLGLLFNKPVAKLVCCLIFAVTLKQ